MQLWGIIWGALLGALWPGYSEIGFALGALLGWVAALTLRRAVRSEIDARLRGERAALAKAQTLSTSEAGLPQRVEPVVASAPSVAVPPAAPVLATPQARATSAPTAPLVDDDFGFSDFPSATADIPPAFQPRPKASPLPGFVQAIQTWLLGGNTIVRVGLVILFIGLAFLARHAAQLGLFPPELRLATVGGVGIALLVLGFRQRLAKPGFGLSLQGAGVGVMYLTVLAAFRLYTLLPQSLAFGLLVLIAALGVALALLQNSRALAFGAFAGGFAAPLLLSTGSGNHIVLFGYYTLLDLSILFIASRRAWRELNLLGFVATFGSALLWGWMRYSPEHYASAQAFLLVFIAIFIAAALLHARQRPMKLGHYVDTALVFGTPLVGFGLQAGLVQEFWHGTAFAALGFGAVYLVLAAVLMRRAGPGYRLLVECCIAIGVGFTTLAVPLAMDQRWTSAVWALEGAAAFWVGMRQARWMARAFGLLLQVLAILVWVDTLQAPVSAWPLVHPGVMGALLIALPMLASAHWLRKPLAHSESRGALLWVRLERHLSTPWFLMGFVIACWAWGLEAFRATPAVLAGAARQTVLAPHNAGLAWMLAVLLSAAAALAWARREHWDVAAWPSRITLLLLGVTRLWQWENGWHTPQALGWLFWPLAIALHLALLRANERPQAHSSTAPSPKWQLWLGAQHPLGAWLGMALLGDTLWWVVERAGLMGTAWASVVGLFSATAVLLALTLWAGRANNASGQARFGWPLHLHAQRYYWSAVLPLVALVALGTLALAWTSSGRTEPLPYIPLLNPTDLAVALALGAMLLWRRTVMAARPQPAGAAWLAQPAFWAALGGLALIALSTVWLRMAHHFFALPWNAQALYASFVVQTGYSILWTLAALVLMVGAHRRQSRPAWLAGAGLLVLVIAKLIVIDLSNRGGGERIVGFISVGVLMLVVGYFAPLPPRQVPADNRSAA